MKMKPKTTRWNRDHSKVAEYYYLWEIEVMKKPEHIHDIDVAMNIILVPDLKIEVPE